MNCQTEMEFKWKATRNGKWNGNSEGRVGGKHAELLIAFHRRVMTAEL